jgi:DNA-binding GntR family transcriptional regulator
MDNPDIEKDLEFFNVGPKSRRSRPVLRDTAYRKFMDHLLSGSIRPGLLVSQRELCEATGATIGSMREALKRLEAEGTITLIPQRGVMVREPGEDEINEVYEARKIVETHATRIYAESGDLKRMAEIKSQTFFNIERKAETRAETSQLLKDRIKVDDLLHETLIKSLNNLTLEKIFDQLRIQIQVIRLGVQPRFIDSRPALREHIEIIEAIEARDPDRAAQSMFDHLEYGRRRAVGLD